MLPNLMEQAVEKNVLCTYWSNSTLPILAGQRRAYCRGALCLQLGGCPAAKSAIDHKDLHANNINSKSSCHGMTTTVTVPL